MTGPNDNKEPIDRLADRDRVRGGTRMIAEGTPVEAVTEALARGVLDQVDAYVKERRIQKDDITNNDIGRAIGYSGPVISEVRRLKYKGDWRSVVIDLDRWLEEQVKRDQAPRPTEFVWTAVAQEILTIANAASTLKTIGLVYGPKTSGIGKTMALEAIAAEKPGSILVTVEKVQASTSGLLYAIAKALRISTGHGNAFLFERIKSILAGTPRLLMVDQIHNLCGAKGDRPLYVLADLWDFTKSPQLWCGTSDIIAYLNRQQQKGQDSLAQIRRRIMPVRDLMERTAGAGPDGRGGRGEPLYTIEEIRKVFGKNKMRLAPDAAKYLWELANLPDGGGLGTAKNVVVMATMLHAEDAGGCTVLSAEMLRGAHRLLVAGPTYKLLQAQLAEATPRAVKAG